MIIPVKTSLTRMETLVDGWAFKKIKADRLFT